MPAPKLGGVKLYFLFILILATTSCLNQSEAPKIPGLDGPKFNIMDGKIYLSVGLENIALPESLTMSIPKMDNSSVTLKARPEGGSLIQVAFDIEDVDRDIFKIVPRHTLPNGEPFPFVTGGEIPSLAFHLPEAFNMTFYASQRVFGFYLPMNVPDGFKFSETVRIRVNDKNIGVFTIVGDKSTDEGSGLILMLTLEEIRTNNNFKTLLKFSKKKKNEHIIF
jgi:hypothetical protein